MADIPNPLRSKKPRPWQEIAEEMHREENPERMLELAIELNNTMLEDERQREKERMERNPTPKRRRMCSRKGFIDDVTSITYEEKGGRQLPHSVSRHTQLEEE